MENHGAAMLDQFAELTIIIVRALIKAVKGPNIKEILQTVRANTNEERFSNAIHNLLMSFMTDREKTNPRRRNSNLSSIQKILGWRAGLRNHSCG